MEEKVNNLELWNKVEKTNPKYTKKAKLSGRDITAIHPQYQIMQVTEQFGVYGQKWGFKNINLSYDLVEKCNLVVFKATFFFPSGEFEIINSCKLYMDRNLQMVDDNFAKKIETDALTKAISKLGFNADIFMGKFDNQRYVDEMNNEFNPKPTPKSPINPELFSQGIQKADGNPSMFKKLIEKFDLTIEQKDQIFQECVIKAGSDIDKLKAIGSSLELTKDQTDEILDIINFKANL
jgi:hypothetical protein